MVPTPGFFGPTPPYQIGVRIDAEGNTVQTSWGRLTLPNVDGYLDTGFAEHNGEWKFKIGGVVKRKHEKEIAIIAKLVREHVAKNSIYKAKAVKIDFRDQDGERKEFNPADSPEFIAIDPNKLDDVVYPREIEGVVNMTLFYPVIYKDAARAMGTPLKRGTLLEGPYGTGKTLTAYQLAAHGMQHGWTFVYLMDVRDLDLAMKFASHYAPAIVFAEDIDQVARMGMRDKAEVNRLTNVLDGIDSKGKEISVVFTTNGTATATATANLTAANVRSIVDYMKKRLIPTYDGSNYICVAGVAALSGLHGDTAAGGWQDVSKYTQAYAANVINGMVGKFYHANFVEETGYLSNSIGSGSVYGQALFFGNDVVYEAVAIPEEVRVKLATDYGRDMGLGWYALLGFKKVWDLAADGEQHIVFVTSA